MRRHQTNKAQRPDGQRRRRGQRRGEQQQHDARRRQRHSYGARGVAAKRQHRQPAAAQRRDRQQCQHYPQRIPRLLRRHAVGGAGDPRDHLRHTRIAARLKHHQQHGKRRAERHPGKQHPVRREPAASGGNQDNHQRRRRADTPCRQQPAKGVARHEQQHHHHAERCAGTDAQHFRARHRVASQPLDNAARRRQHRARAQRRQHARPAPAQQLAQHIALRPDPAVGIAPKTERQRRHAQEQQQTRQRPARQVAALRRNTVARVHLRRTHGTQAR
ncbi:Basic proline-rich protein precursor [Cronobacter muytjensii 530]